MSDHNCCYVGSFFFSPSPKNGNTCVCVCVGGMWDTVATPQTLLSIWDVIRIQNMIRLCSNGRKRMRRNVLLVRDRLHSLARYRKRESSAIDGFHCCDSGLSRFRLMCWSNSYEPGFYLVLYQEGHRMEGRDYCWCLPCRLLSILSANRMTFNDDSGRCLSVVSSTYRRHINEILACDIPAISL